VRVVEVVLGALGGAALAVVITAGRVWLLRRFGEPRVPVTESRRTGPVSPDNDAARGAASVVCVPPSPEVLEAERRYRARHTRTPRRPPTPPASA
jgi:hypothetical protein